mgnify:FL=1
MNDFSYDDLAVGQMATFSRTVTGEMMEAFRRLSGDENPLHNDVEFAVERGFSGRVVYGMLTASLYSALAGVYLLGKRCLLQSVYTDFLHPVFIGETLTITGKIVEKHDSVRQVIIKATIRNTEGKRVSRAKIEAGVI